MGKKVFVAFFRPPVSSSFHVEGLRMAIGIVSGADDHKITVAYIGKGARCAVRGVDRSYSTTFIEFLPDKAGKKFLVDEESLKEEGIDLKELADDFAVVSRKELSRMMLDADVTLSF